MPRARNGEVELEYETFGVSGGKPLVLVHGLGSSLLVWDARLCRLLTARGMYVVRMDNRDSGLSTVLVPGTAYTLSDMAGDVMAVLDDAGIERAVVCGFSLGGMVAQVAAAEHPDRVAGLVSVGSNTGEPAYGRSTEEAWAALAAPAAGTIAGQIEIDLVGYRIWTNPQWRDTDAFRGFMRRSYERAWNPGASDRQFAAADRTGNRAQVLRGLDLPAAVVHGADDPLIGADAGRRTAELIAGSAYVEIEHMRHDLAPQIWPRLADTIEAVVSRAAW